MKENDIFSNCISGVSLERRERNKKVFGEEPEYQNLRIYCEGRERRGIHMQYMSTDWFSVALCSEGQRAEFLGQRKCSGSVRTSTGLDWPSKFQTQGFSNQEGPCASGGAGAETKHLWVTDLQTHSPGTGAWWESLALCTQNKKCPKVLGGQQHVFVHRYKWEQAQKGWALLLAFKELVTGLSSAAWVHE